MEKKIDSPLSVEQVEEVAKEIFKEWTPQELYSYAVFTVVEDYLTGQEPFNSDWEYAFNSYSE